MESYILNFLQENNIPFTLYTHQAVFSCEESEIHCKHIPGISVKNLFLKEEKGKKYFLVILSCKNQLKMNFLAPILNVRKLKFASKQELKEILGLTPGSVSILGLLNDKEKKVQLIIDQELLDAEAVSFHPNINTESLVFEQQAFHKMVEFFHYKWKIETVKNNFS